MAFLDERQVMLDVLREALDLIAYLETYWQFQRDNGDRAPQTIVAQGKLFQRIHAFHKSGLRKRIIEVRENLDKVEAKYMKLLGPKMKEGQR